MTDWTAVRRAHLSKERPDEWPPGVYAISIDGLSLMGVHERHNTLYWDGKEIVTRKVVRLGKFEQWIAGVAAVSTLGIFILGLGEVAGWWR